MVRPEYALIWPNQHDAGKLPQIANRERNEVPFEECTKPSREDFWRKDLAHAAPSDPICFGELTFGIANERMGGTMDLSVGLRTILVILRNKCNRHREIHAEFFHLLLAEAAPEMPKEHEQNARIVHEASERLCFTSGE